MTRAIRITRNGGPELIDVGALTPGPGQILLRQRASGADMIDISHRQMASGQ